MATALVNTSGGVRRAGDLLDDPAALDRFLAEHEIARAGTDSVPSSEADLGQVHALREEVRTILEVDSEDAVVERATALVARAGIGPGLSRDATGRWQWYVTTSDRATLADELAVLIGIGLLSVVRTLSHDRLRHCAAPDCSGMFVDTSRAGRRRYCMPDLCGNRLNVAKYRARRRDAP